MSEHLEIHRDNIPNLMRKQGLSPVVRVVRDDRLLNEMQIAKLRSAVESMNPDEGLLNDIAEAQALLWAIAARNGHTKYDIDDMCLLLEQRLGGYRERVGILGDEDSI